ncbi:hypothetical protein [Chamaesiphon polymorphus]|uniref:Uncharacterized protein n=1 Tax=Chamaesiphon polymorphus CCALA 037 TaxID=2107692 RepID=A0A2T1G7L4_9CYAN|nr:hypothetical protein [Chamaesiphon polymorphus]PSB53238.1 hypothetical protein C7B77_19765 [Chamaesiphon polymorphus CCALA 037]
MSKWRERTRQISSYFDEEGLLYIPMMVGHGRKEISSKLREEFDNIGATFFASYFYSRLHEINDILIKELISSQNPRILRFGQALAVGSNKLYSIENFDNELLKIMFSNIKLSKEFIQENFKDPCLCSDILKNFSINCDTTLNYHLSNLANIIDTGLVDISAVSHFIVKYFKQSKYLFDMAIKMFASAIKNDPNLVNKLIDPLLYKIDPFNCAISYSTWLIDINKYIFVRKLIIDNVSSPYSASAQSFIDRQTILDKYMRWHKIKY